MQNKKIAYYYRMAVFGFLFPFFNLLLAEQQTRETLSQNTSKSMDTQASAQPGILPPGTLQQVFYAGDALLISTYPDTTTFFRGVHQIDDQGFVDLPALGKLRVIDKTEKQLADKLVAEYVNYLRYPIVQVHPLIRVSLLGGFFRPGLYWVLPSSSLWDVVAMVGGTRREDGIKNIRWERSKVIIKEDLVNDFQSGGSLQQMGFVSGDQFWATSQPKQDIWEIIRLDVLPMVSITVTSVSTSIMAYQIYRLWKEGR